MASKMAAAMAAGATSGGVRNNGSVIRSDSLQVAAINVVIQFYRPAAAPQMSPGSAATGSRGGPAPRQLAPAPAASPPPTPVLR